MKRVGTEKRCVKGKMALSPRDLDIMAGGPWIRISSCLMDQRSSRSSGISSDLLALVRFLDLPAVPMHCGLDSFCV